MPHSTTANAGWPDPRGLALRLLVAFALATTFAWLGGRTLVEAVLPFAHAALRWLDDSFGVLFLGLDQTGQDTVVRLRLNILRWFVVGTFVVEPQTKGWLEVTTTVGAMLQPLAIALGLAGAWPGRLLLRALRVALAAALAVLFMLVDIPLTLHAYVWDMFIDRFDPQGFSPLLVLHRFLHGGGRLAVGILLGVLAVQAVPRWVGARIAGRTMAEPPDPSPTPKRG